MKMNSSVCVCVRAPPPPTRGAGRAAGHRADGGAAAGLRGDDLTVHGAQQQHQTHGPKQLTGTGRRHLHIHEERCHCGRQPITVTGHRHTSTAG